MPAALLVILAAAHGQPEITAEDAGVPRCQAKALQQLL